MAVFPLFYSPAIVPFWRLFGKNTQLADTVGYLEADIAFNTHQLGWFPAASENMHIYRDHCLFI
jgi:hypothetical protein